MSDEPWDQCKLGDLFTVQRQAIVPSARPNSEFYHHSLPAWDEYGGPLVERGSAIESNKTLITSPCVLFSKLNPRKPRVSVVDDFSSDTPHCASTEFVCLRPWGNQSLQFWGHYLAARSFSRRLERHAIGSTNSHTRVNPRAPLSWDLSVPPLNEQQLIAHILDTLDTQIRRTEEVIAKLEQVKQGLLTDLRTRGIDENGELRPSTKEAPELYKDSRVGRIPLEWSVLPISDVVDLPSGQVSPLASEYRDMPLVAPDHIEAGTGKLLDVESAAEQGAISGKYVFRPRDVIYSKIRPYLKKAWLADRHGLCSADMYPLRPRPGHSPVFVLNILLGNEFSSFANSVSMRTGIPKINRSELRTYETAVPPANEQRRIESTIEASDTDLENERVALGKLLNTKVGLMDDLLTGRVRVIPLLEEAEQAVG